jgi:ribosomal protein L11 methyltransferase
MVYKSVQFKLDPFSSDNAEILFALLDQYNYNGVNEKKDTIMAYIPVEKFSRDDLDDIRTFMEKVGCHVNWELKNVSEKNWNLIWERNFKPVLIKNKCIVRAPFHGGFPKIPIELIIEPKMSFGTGHHQTTRLMIEKMLDFDFQDKVVLDMGCGTGILSILASKLGAEEVIALDIDKWSYANTLENIQRNSIQNIQVLHGGNESLPEKKFDIVLANINLNVLLEHMKDYSCITKKGGVLFLSGILNEDRQIIQSLAQQYCFELIEDHLLDGWLIMSFNRN